MIGSIATGIGVVGFVTFVGGAIEWIRFDRAGIPPTKAVGAVPKTDLIVEGAVGLAPQLLAGLAVVLVLRCFDWLLDFTGLKGKIKAGAVVFVLTGLGVLYANEVAGLPPEILLLLLVLVAVLVGFSLWVRTAHDDSFLWFAGMLLVSVGLFAAALGFIRTARVPKLQSAAVLRAGERTAIAGLYVAETSDRIYLAEAIAQSDSPALGRAASGRIFVIPRDQVSGFAVGSFASLPDAQEQARNLGDELRRRFPPLPEAPSNER